MENYNNNSIPQVSHSPYGILVERVGVCDGYAEAVCLILGRMGIECIKVMGESKIGESWEGHAWNIVRIDGDYYHMDATWYDPVWNNGKNMLEHDYFLLSDLEIVDDHKWDGDKYPACKGNKY